MDNYIIILGQLMKYAIEKYGLWQTIFAFLALFSIPVLLYKLDAILTAVYLYL